MNADQIRKMAEATLSGAISFPEIIGQLIAEGVEYYHVDYVSKAFTCFDEQGSVVMAPFPLEGMPSVASDFNAAELRAAILDSQQNGQAFKQFCARAIASGVQSYYAFLRGKRVLYIGRQGEHHVEWFPGANQSSTPN